MNAILDGFYMTLDRGSNNVCQTTKQTSGVAPVDLHDSLVSCHHLTLSFSEPSWPRTLVQDQACDVGSPSVYVLLLLVNKEATFSQWLNRI